ncbi:MAG: M55 family metallopeptidase [Clostridia bacterium]|nr:M55 family metallopeptidase [Clostridia bacterium]
MKKLFISGDIEGCCGVTTWDETYYGHKGYKEACEQYTREVVAACEAAIEAGWKVVVKDGHEDAMNIEPMDLPEGVELIRGWPSSLSGMMAGLDETFDAVAYIGYHAAESTGDNPIAHTIEHYLFDWVKLNGELCSEFTLNSLWAAEFGVPSIFLSGDQGICDHAKAQYPSIFVAPTKKCKGGATWNKHPLTACKDIKEQMALALQSEFVLPEKLDNYEIVMCYKEHQYARYASQFEGAELLDSKTVRFSAKTFMELARGRSFMTGGGRIY